MKRAHLPILAIVLATTLSAAVAVTQEAVTADLGIDPTALPIAVGGFDDVTAGVFRDGFPSR